MTRFKKSFALILGLSCVGGVLWAFSSVIPSRENRVIPTTGPAALGFAGASCAGRACHGGDVPLTDELVQRNEYTTMLLYDKHTQAYSVLLGERAKLIARNLATNSGQPEVKAHEDWRCLACHATPQSAWAQYQGGKADLATQNWQLGGVSCEACHGPSRKGDKSWFDLHTAKAAWKDKNKEEYHFYQLSDFSRQAQVCAGCHVGAPPDKDNNIPPRDCNHDIMAAGHPRLNFELSVYRANMPPHWNVEKKKDDEAKVWMHGRLASAKASLELLIHRAEQAEKPDGKTVRWPEFAEYRCYSCHKGLNNDWRGATNEAGRPRGSMPYDSWYGSLLPTLNPELKEGYEKLTSEMARPLPSTEAVKTQAKALLEKLKPGKDVSASELAKKITEAHKTVPRSWEDAMQLTLALAALKASDPAQLRELARALSFPTNEKFKGEGPRGIGYVEDLESAQKAYAEVLKGIK